MQEWVLSSHAVSAIPPDHAHQQDLHPLRHLFPPFRSSTSRKTWNCSHSFFEPVLGTLYTRHRVPSMPAAQKRTEGVTFVRRTSCVHMLHGSDSLTGGSIAADLLLCLEGPFVTVRCTKAKSRTGLRDKGCRDVDITFLDGTFSLLHTEHRHHDCWCY